MRVSPINALNNPYSNLKYNACKPKPCYNQINFKKGRECTKMLGAFFGMVTASWALARTSSQTGEIDFLVTAIYGIVGTVLGAMLGNKVDDDIDNNKKGGFGKTA